jgi:hypothetical protein
MKIVQGDEVARIRGLEYRGGIFHFRHLVEGEPATLDNFQLSLGEVGGDFFSPRHRHNFEQVRFQLEGTLDFGRDGKMSPGMVGFFPEGVAYGPQTQKPDEGPYLTAVLQCGGASGSGYLSREEVKRGVDELRKYGEFKDGVFRRRKDVPGKRNLDAYQAIWEFMNQRAMAYPKGRYAAPIMMDPANYQWVPVAGMAGVSEKLLGIFTERRSTVRLLKLAAGASYEAAGRSLYLTFSGTGSIASRKLRRLTTLFVERGETAPITADETTELLHLGLPDLAGMALRQPASAAAAE